MTATCRELGKCGKYREHANRVPGNVMWSNGHTMWQGLPSVPSGSTKKRPSHFLKITRLGQSCPKKANKTKKEARADCTPGVVVGVELDVVADPGGSRSPAAHGDSHPNLQGVQERLPHVHQDCGGTITFPKELGPRSFPSQAPSNPPL